MRRPAPPAPHGTAPHRTAPHRTARHRIAPHRAPGGSAGGPPLRLLIATVVQEVRTAGDAPSLEAALVAWRARVTARGLAMLKAAALLSDYAGARAG
ncbi:hypothetical protein [Streptomyces hydrogenans]|uniref:hypothetical protein n=1 Tax=Streptomyces hydrogenans TaxID=1873719 RepID=UPI00380B89E9